MKAAIIQFAPELGNLEANYRQIKKLASRAAHANLVVLPELSNSGYNFSSKAQALALAEPINNSRFIDLLANIAHQNNQFIVAGMNELSGDKLYNSAVLVGPGGYLGKYRKAHLFWNEFDFFEKGDTGFPVFEINGTKIGILICFDWIFPEAWRVLALKGAEIICHPSNLVLPYAQQAVPVQCMMNRVYALTANRYGTEGGVTFSGRSFASDPTGKTVFTAPAAEDAVYITQIDPDLARNKMITPRNHVINDRRPDIYRELADSNN